MRGPNLQRPEAESLSGAAPREQVFDAGTPPPAVATRGARARHSRGRAAGPDRRPVALRHRGRRRPGALPGAGLRDAAQPHRRLPRRRRRSGPAGRDDRRRHPPRRPGGGARHLRPFRRCGAARPDRQLHCLPPCLLCGRCGPAQHRADPPGGRSPARAQRPARRQRKWPPATRRPSAPDPSPATVARCFPSTSATARAPAWACASAAAPSISISPVPLATPSRSASATASTWRS